MPGRSRLTAPSSARLTRRFRCDPVESIDKDVLLREGRGGSRAALLPIEKPGSVAHLDVEWRIEPCEYFGPDGRRTSSPLVASTTPAPSTSDRRTDAGALAPTDDAADHGAGTGSDADVAGVLLLGALRLAAKGFGSDVVGARANRDRAGTAPSSPRGPSPSRSPWRRSPRPETREPAGIDRLASDAHVTATRAETLSSTALVSEATAVTRTRGCGSRPAR